MDEKRGTAATKAKNKYNAKSYDRLYPYITKGKKAVYQAAADRMGVSLNSFIELACDALAELSNDVNQK